ncbi:pyruvate kinase [Neobacillus sp. OS1-2]|uniref:pyruvate kinase n=1 Tax=Neobacillus sp. OS1-2 TaxID=3070680 RepID=UPI0027E0B2BC|nr:pyruvate kinase [Neobacillus sp. OS1-2]WML39806.1 pyruvate kinase [Neobacillus sp. OS1-2]
MVNSTIHQQELSQRLLGIYHLISEECEQIQQNFPLDNGKENRDNLLAYLALREKKIPVFQHELVDRGLATLEHSHKHVIFTLEKLLKNLNVTIASPSTLNVPTPSEAMTMLNKRAEALFGKKGPYHQAAIMVTLDAKMINNQVLLEELLLNGMTIARINCAHDDQEIWKQLIDCVREAEKKLKTEGRYNDKACKLYMDLSGPKVRVGRLQPDVNIAVRKGDILRLYLQSDILGHPATSEGPAGVPVTLEKAFRNVRINDQIFIDDGRIYGMVQAVTKEYIQIVILSPIEKKHRIKEGKGINLPDSLLSLNVPALTEKDILDLTFITKNADIVGISFVHTPLDLIKLREHLEIYNAAGMAVVAKIETKDALHQLARIILEGLNFNSFGIMIARGDLAVEVGPGNLSFVQEEILTICSAAYIPVIWATGVLEKLTKKGIPARSEITDASQGKRADCVMLNKGPYIVHSLKMLNKLLKKEELEPHRHENLTVQYGILDRK